MYKKIKHCTLPLPKKAGTGWLRPKVTRSLYVGTFNAKSLYIFEYLEK